jgi:hypothetical protein
MLHLRVGWQRGFLVGGTRTHALLHLRCAFSAPFLQARHLAVLRFHVARTAPTTRASPLPSLEPEMLGGWWSKCTRVGWEPE